MNENKEIHEIIEWQFLIERSKGKMITCHLSFAKYSMVLYSGKVLQPNRCTSKCYWIDLIPVGIIKWIDVCLKAFLNKHFDNIKFCGPLWMSIAFSLSNFSKYICLMNDFHLIKNKIIIIVTTHTHISVSVQKMVLFTSKCVKACENAFKSLWFGKNLLKIHSFVCILKAQVKRYINSSSLLSHPLCWYHRQFTLNVFTLAKKATHFMKM